jgi:signal transduction histidine kinase
VTPGSRGAASKKRPRFRLRPRSLTAKLSFLFFAITALAFAVVIFFFLPRLEGQLQDRQLEELRGEVARTAPEIERAVGTELDSETLDRLVRSVADRTNARVTLLNITQANTPPRTQFYPITDSNAEASIDPNVGLARRALGEDGGKPRTIATKERGEAEVARPLLSGDGQPDYAVLYSRSFEDAHSAVVLVRTRLLWASAVALAVALLAGIGTARAISARVRAIERAARDVAEGRDTKPLPVTSDDELGSLALAFNEMQERLSLVDRARREFIANASHELRTPIFSLGGFVELLQDEELDEATRTEFLNTMGEQVQRLQKLAVDLLDLSRLDAGSLQLDLEEVDLATLATEITGEFRPAIAAHGIDLDLDLPDDPVDAICDRGRVVQIMRILLDNALRHTPEGTPVTVSTATSDGRAEFAVSDRGPGIDPTTRAQLFERFYTGDKARGSGLGLAIAKELAERMNGHITLRSEPGHTTFALELPLAASERDPAGAGAS